MQAPQQDPQGRLAENIVYFARALRAAGIPVGPGSVLDALEAVRAAGIGTKEDFYWTLHAVFVKRHDHSVLFDQAFKIFFRKRGYLEQLIAMMSPEMTGAQITCAALEAEGVTVAFGYPGGAVIPLYDAFPTANLHHILVRFEQWAALAADAYARVTGDVGVCIATSGPGATNLVTGLANAMLDSVPIVAITGQVIQPDGGLAM